MSKYKQWWDSLNPQMQEYLKRQPIWHDRDMFKSLMFGVGIGFVIGVVVGYEWAFKPIVNCFKPLIG